MGEKNGMGNAGIDQREKMADRLAAKGLTELELGPKLPG